MMLSTRMVWEMEISVPVELANVAISLAPLGTVFGVQFDELFQLPSTGARFQAALPALAALFVRYKISNNKSATLIVK